MLPAQPRSVMCKSCADTDSVGMNACVLHVNRMLTPNTMPAGYTEHLRIYSAYTQHTQDTSAYIQDILKDTQDAQHILRIY